MKWNEMGEWVRKKGENQNKTVSGKENNEEHWTCRVLFSFYVLLATEMKDKALYCIKVTSLLFFVFLFFLFCQ